MHTLRGDSIMAHTCVYEMMEELRTSEDPVDKIVAAFWDDITDRRGFRQAMDECDDDIKIEIVEEWREKVKKLVPLY